MKNKGFNRYQRQILLEELGIEGQNKLQKSAVLVIGAGGLGCPLLFYLTGAGIGKIGIIDGDTIAESNLHRQLLFQQQDIGENKALKAVERLKLLNPGLELNAHPFHISQDNAHKWIGEYDLVIDGSDNFPTRYLVNDTCVALAKPLVFGSIFHFEGQVSVFNYQGGPNYRNCYPEPPSSKDSPNCGDSGVIGPLPGIIGSMMANEAIKIIAGFGTTLSGKLLIFNALNYDMQVFNIQTENQQTPENKEPKSEGLPAVPVPKKKISYEEIFPKELLEWEAQNLNFCLIDVREAHEFEAENIGGIHISLYELEERIDELPFQNRLVFCCTSGAKSRMATKIIGEKRKEELFIVSLLNR